MPDGFCAIAPAERVAISAPSLRLFVPKFWWDCTQIYRSFLCRLINLATHPKFRSLYGSGQNGAWWNGNPLRSRNCIYALRITNLDIYWFADRC